MKKTFKQLKKTVVFLLVFVLSFSFGASALGTTAYAAENTNSYIEYNKEMYDGNKALCDRIADGMTNFSEQIYIGDFKISDKDLIRYIMKTVIRKHPELFYVDQSKFMTGSDGTYIAVVCPIYKTDKQTALSQIDTFNQKVSQYLEKTDSSMTDFEKAVVLHDELALNCEYLDEDGTGHISAYDAIVDGKTNCQGYSEAYSYLLSLAGINSEIVESSAMYHIWNKVKIDGSYYNVDLTWDDPMPDKKGHVSHKYFMLSDTAIASGDDEISSHYGFDYAYYKSANTKYDKWLFREFDTKLCFVNGDCYVVDNKYASKYEKCLLKYNTASNTAEIIKRFDYRWKSGATSYWIGGYMSLDEYNGMLYYNSPDRVYTYDIKNNTTEKFSAVDTTLGNCYGIRITDGVVFSAVASSPNVESTLVSVGNCKETVFVTTPSTMMGDVNEDGVLNIVDVTIIQKHSSGIITFADELFLIADINADGIINIIDATSIQKQIVNS